MLIDVHSHLDMLETTAEETLALARQAGVTKLITIGTEPQDHQLYMIRPKDSIPIFIAP
jgi:TatD DNase family protein